MPEIRKSKQFKKAWAKYKNSGNKSVPQAKERLKIFLGYLARGEVIPAKFADHPLKNTTSNERDAHILNDLVLIYRPDRNGNNITLINIDNHSNIFG